MPIHPFAQTAAFIASAQAQAAEGDSLPLPPKNLPALRSIRGETSLDRALVLGYKIKPQEVRDCIAPDGSISLPGNPGFREAQEGRLGLAPMPKGWMFETRTTFKLLAIVDGNPILLEKQAKELGYSRALATGPNTLDLGEIDPGM
jgi:hypothetical protein